MSKLILGLMIGLIVGGALTFLLFVGVPRAAQTPGSPIKAPDVSAPAGSAQIVLKQEFFNEILTTIFRDMSDPAFPLAVAANPVDEQPHITHAVFQDGQLCDGKITVREEGSGVRTSVRFENNRISAPFAFAGNYYTPFGCIQFTGWAQANLELRYDAAARTVFGRINVETVNLDGVNPIVGGIVTPLVQTTLNNRVNPIPVLSGDQIAIDVPIASAAGRLRATVNDVRAEFRDDALNLYVIYAFKGAPIQ
ncbi:MAG TPA: hypothetical protein VNA17_04850 [Pyrinomonadaceae bacterium]|nr:hypothetical protein [Pyrinomonadaceae bacterium]